MSHQASWRTKARYKHEEVLLKANKIRLDHIAIAIDRLIFDKYQHIVLVKPGI